MKIKERVIGGIKMAAGFGIGMIVSGIIENSREDKDDGTLTKVLIGLGGLVLGSYITTKMGDYIDDVVTDVELSIEVIKDDIKEKLEQNLENEGA